jgi:hypothetical protein
VFRSQSHGPAARDGLEAAVRQDRGRADDNLKGRETLELLVFYILPRLPKFGGEERLYTAFSLAALMYEKPLVAQPYDIDVRQKAPSSLNICPIRLAVRHLCAYSMCVFHGVFTSDIGARFFT